VNPDQDADCKIHAVVFDPMTGIEEKVSHRHDEKARMKNQKSGDVFQDSGSLEAGRGVPGPS
jgi:hypothetical protein